MSVVTGKAFVFVSQESVRSELTSLDPTVGHIFCCLGGPVELEDIDLPALPFPQSRFTVVSSDREVYFEGEESVHLLCFDPSLAHSTLSLQLRMGEVVLHDLEVALNSVGGGEVVLTSLAAGEYSVFQTNSGELCRFQMVDHSVGESERLLFKKAQAEFREAVAISSLGEVWSVSQEGQQAGEFHLSSLCQTAGSPFELVRVGSGELVLCARELVSPMKAVVLNPVTEELVHFTWESCTKGQECLVAYDSMFSVVAIGAFVDGIPWEGWVLTTRSDGFESALNLPSSVKAGDDLEVEIKVPEGYQAYLSVKDSRLVSPCKPAQKLVSRVFEFAREIESVGQPGCFELALGHGLSAWEKEVLDRLKAREGIDEKQYERLVRSMSLTGLNFVQALALTLKRSEFEVVNLCLPDILDGIAVEPEALCALSTGLCRFFGVYPLRIENDIDLVVGVVDPADTALSDLQLITGYSIRPIALPEETMEWLLKSCLRKEAFDSPVTVMPEFGAPRRRDGLATEMPVLNQDNDESLAELSEFRVEAEMRVLYCGWLNGSGLIRRSIPTNLEECADLAVEVFVVGARAWTTLESSVMVRRELAVRVETPSYVHPDDTVDAELEILGGEPPFLIKGERDGLELNLPNRMERNSPVTFVCAPGSYRFTVEEISTGRREVIERKVEVAGRMSGVRKSLKWLPEGDSVVREPATDLLGMEPFPSPVPFWSVLSRQTSNYQHMCSEQTAAKIFSACVAWLLSKEEERPKLESIALAGIAHQRRMFRIGEGFALYRRERHGCRQFGVLAATYLCQLELYLERVTSESFAAVLREAVALGKASLKCYGRQWPSTLRESLSDCYWELRHQGLSEGLVERILALRAQPVRSGVWERAADCYFAAALLRARSETHASLALEVANRVLAETLPEGRFYSTVDSVAAMVLTEELAEYADSVTLGTPQVEGRPEQPDRITALGGPILVRESRYYFEDWKDRESKARITVEASKSELQLGSRLELRVSLPDGYQKGDLAWLCLPPSLAKLNAGAQVRRFSVDFEGRDSVTVEVVATAPTPAGQQTLLLCLKNMFEEERFGLAEPLRISVSCLPGPSSVQCPTRKSPHRAPEPTIGV